MQEGIKMPVLKRYGQREIYIDVWNYLAVWYVIIKGPGKIFI